MDKLSISLAKDRQKMEPPNSMVPEVGKQHLKLF